MRTTDLLRLDGTLAHLASLLGAAGIVLAIVLSARLGAPQLRGLGAWRVRTDPDAPGAATPLAAVGASFFMGFGLLGLVRVGTGLALGGAGTIVWWWLFAIVFAGVRHAETWLARRHAAPTSVAVGLGDLAGHGAPGRLAKIVAATTVVGAALVTGVAARELALPAARAWGSLPISGAVAAGAAIVVCIAGAWLGARATTLSAVVGMAGLALVMTALGGAFAVKNGHAGVMARALVDVFEGAPNLGAFTGAAAGEVLVAALRAFLPSLGTSGLAGALHGDARAHSTRGQAALAMTEPFIGAFVGTFVGLAVLASGVMAEPPVATRPLDELYFFRGPFESASQRREEARLYDGYVRVRDGRPMHEKVEVATERGVVVTPRFARWKKPADVALHIANGRVVRLLAPDPEERGSLVERPPSDIRSIVVEGRMLRMGADLLGDASHAGALGGNGPRVFAVGAFLLFLAGLLGLGRASAAAAIVFGRNAPWGAAVAVGAGGLLALLGGGFVASALDAALALTATSTLAVLAVTGRYARA